MEYSSRSIVPVSDDEGVCPQCRFCVRCRTLLVSCDAVEHSKSRQDVTLHPTLSCTLGIRFGRYHHTLLFSRVDRYR